MRSNSYGWYRNERCTPRPAQSLRATMSYWKAGMHRRTVAYSSKRFRCCSRKIVMHQTIHQEGTEKLCCEADISIVLVNSETGRPAVLSEEIIRAWPDLGSANDHQVS